MTEKYLDIAIEKCERIMEFDTRTLKNPESENGWLFDKVYDLLQFLRQFEFATDTNVGGDLIDRQAAIDALIFDVSAGRQNGKTLAVRYAEEVFKRIKALPSAQPGWIPCSERLPEKPGQYYVSGGDNVWICEFIIIPNFIGGWCNDAVNPVVQAWMPLPEPYREEDGD